MAKFGEQLKRWRSAKKLSQAAAASELGLSVGTLQGWEQGRHTPTGPALAAFGDRFKLPASRKVRPAHARR